MSALDYTQTREYYTQFHLKRFVQTSIMLSPLQGENVTDKTKFDLNRTAQRGSERTGYSKQSLDVETTQNTPSRKLYFGLSLHRWLFLYGLFAATVITWVVSQNITQFEQHGPVAFHNGFPGDLEQWSRKGGWENILFEQDGVKLHRNVDKASYAVRTFALAPSDNRAQEKLDVSGLIKTITKKPSTDSSLDGGAITIRLQDDSDKVVKFILVGRLDGLSDQYEVNRVIDLTENITRFSLVFYNKQSSAEFALVDASVSLVTELPAFRNARIAIFLLWSILLLIALYYLFTHASKTMFGVITTVIVLTFVGVLMPETIRAGAITPVYKTVQNLMGLTNNVSLVYAFKVGHFVFFFLSTLILLLYRKPLQLLAWEIFLLMFLFAIATEGLQLYQLDRTTRITDLIIDFSAIIAGAIITLLIVTIRTILSKKSKSPTVTLN